MKFSSVRSFFALTIITLSIACNKGSSDDNSYFIEATINGVKWRGESTGNFLARMSGSKMKIYFTQMNPPTGSFNFFSNSSLLTNPVITPDYTMRNFVIGAFDSRLTLKWETTAENNIDRFEIEESSPPGAYRLIGSVAASGTSNTLKQYSFTPVTAPDLDYLHTTHYRIKVITNSGTFRYTAAKTPTVHVGKAQIAYVTSSNKLYFALDNDQNNMSILSYDPDTVERSGTFSFNYKDEAGNIIEVKNGKFRLKY